jgi:hypothetical protein
VGNRKQTKLGYNNRIRMWAIQSKNCRNLMNRWRENWWYSRACPQKGEPDIILSPVVGRCRPKTGETLSGGLPPVCVLLISLLFLSSIRNLAVLNYRTSAIERSLNQLCSSISCLTRSHQSWLIFWTQPIVSPHFRVHVFAYDRFLSDLFIGF